jgi:hypothetical protein
MTDEVTSYTKEECLPKRISPTGVKYGVFRVDEVDLYEVRAINTDDEGNEKPDYQRKQPVLGHFTGAAKADAALVQCLVLQWEASDAIAKKNRKAA